LLPHDTPKAPIFRRCPPFLLAPKTTTLEPPSESIFCVVVGIYRAMSFLRRRRRSSLERKKERKKGEKIFKDERVMYYCVAVTFCRLM
tara:strand:+ start:3128 stop:3391 length:264 start_codon:yes stop_codon:yes gene_type:complete